VKARGLKGANQTTKISSKEENLSSLYAAKNKNAFKEIKPKCKDKGVKEGCLALHVQCLLSL
jgi:hypothetical protein